MKAGTWLKKNFKVLSIGRRETTYKVFRRDDLANARTFFIKGAAESHARELKEQSSVDVVYIDKNVCTYIAYGRKNLLLSKK